MKELDVLFERFLQRGFEALNAQQLATLESLLLHPDQDILAWICGREAAPGKAFAELSALIRDSACPG